MEVVIPRLMIPLLEVARSSYYMITIFIDVLKSNISSFADHIQKILSDIEMSNS